MLAHDCSMEYLNLCQDQNRAEIYDTQGVAS